MMFALFEHRHGFLLGLSYIIIFILGLYAGQLPILMRTMTKTNEQRTDVRGVSPNHTFFYLGTKYQSDKVHSHHYERMYEKYLSKYRHLPDVSLLEIGLGCGMPYGPGASAYIWRDYFGPRANIHVIEYNQVCGEQWYKKHGMKVTHCSS